MGQRENLEIELTAGEDFAAQIYWTDEDGDPIPIQEPCRLEVRDSAGLLVMQFATENAASYATKAAIILTGSQGLMQISVPTSITKTVAPGTYLFDLWATTADGVSPFASADSPVASGTFIVLPRITIMEGAVV